MGMVEANPLKTYIPKTWTVYTQSSTSLKKQETGNKDEFSHEIATRLIDMNCSAISAPGDIEVSVESLQLPQPL